MRPQRKKSYQPGENTAYMQQAQELRRSSASEPHRNKSKYNRKQKHRNQGWD